MRFSQMDYALLLQLSLFACGIAWVITGSKIGRIVRVIGYVTTAWIPKKPITSLFFCPPCCTWWCGLGLALWAGLPWQNIFQIAFTSSFIMAILNSQWQLDANDREEIENAIWPGGSKDSVPETLEKENKI